MRLCIIMRCLLTRRVIFLCYPYVELSNFLVNRREWFYQTVLSAASITWCSNLFSVRIPILSQIVLPCYSNVFETQHYVFQWRNRTLLKWLCGLDRLVFYASLMALVSFCLLSMNSFKVYVNSNSPVIEGCNFCLYLQGFSRTRRWRIPPCVISQIIYLFRCVTVMNTLDLPLQLPLRIS